MKSPKLQSVICSTLALSAIHSFATPVGGLDPSVAPDIFATDTAGTFMVIANQEVLSTTDPQTIDLGTSIFRYQSNNNAASAATPFLAIQTGLADSHDPIDYDVIWIGESLANDASGTDVEAALGAGTIELPGNSTIVGGYMGSDGEVNLSPASAVFGEGASEDVLVIAQSTVSVDGDIAVTGTDWSTNGAVTNRIYHYQIDLQQGGTDSDGDGLLDEWEIEHSLDPNDDGSVDPVNGAEGDPDGDGLDNLGESRNGTDPRDDDSDDDLLLDNDEVEGAGSRPPTSPLKSDSDDDGLDDLVETNTGTFASDTDTGTNPLIADTDGDGLSDGEERSGDNPGGFTSDPNLADTDNDGFDDDVEYSEGTDPENEASFPSGQYIGDAAPQFSGVLDNGSVDGANGGALTYALHGSPYTNTSGGDEEIRISEVNFWADGAGDVTPFVVSYNDLGVGVAANYTILAIGDVITATPGETNTVEFTVGGQPASVTLGDGEMILAGFYQTAGVVPFSQPADADADFLDVGVTVGVVGSPFTKDANWSNLPRNYAFNIAIEPGAGVPLAIVDIALSEDLSSATIVFNSRPGTTYAIWASSDLENWIELNDSVKGVPEAMTTSFTDSPLPGDSSRRFYQVREVGN